MAELFRFVKYYTQMYVHNGSWLTGAFYVGLLDGLLGVAGVMKLIVSQWIIPENSLRKTHQEVFRSFWECQMLKNPDLQEFAPFQTLDSVSVPSGKLT